MNSISVLLSIALSQNRSQDLSRKITFSAEGTRLEQFVKSFGEASKLSLTVSRNIADEVICVRLKDVPVQVAMDRIATNLDCSWVPTTEGFRLQRTSPQSSLRDQRGFQNLAAYYAEEQGKMAKSRPVKPLLTPAECENRVAKIAELTKRKPSTNDQTDPISDAFGELPGQRAMNQILATMNPSTLASLKLGQTVVFSTQPNAMQQPMPKVVRTIIAETIAQFGYWRSALQRHLIANGQPANRVDSRRDPSEPDLIDPAKCAKVNLSIRLFPNPTGLYFQLEFLGADGIVLSQNEGVIGDVSDTEAVAIKRFGPPEYQDAQIDLPSNLLALRARMFGRGAERDAALPDPLIKLLLEPEDHDPLGLLYTPIISRYAENLDRNLVFIPSEGDWAMLFSQFSTGKASQKRVQAFLKGETLEVSDKDGWLTIRPRFTTHERLRHTDRHRLGEFARAWMTEQPLTLDDVANFEGYTANLPFDFLATIYGTALKRNSPSASDDPDGVVARLYASLTEPQRQAMVNGGVAFGQLSPEQQSYVRYLVYDRGEVLAVEQSGETTPAIMWQVKAAKANRTRNATELLPTGIPLGARISMKQTTDFEIVPARTPASNSDANRPNGWDAYTVASVKDSQSRPSKRVRTFTYSFDRVRLIESQHVDIKFEFTPELQATESLAYADVRGGKMVNWVDLPATFLKEVDAALKDIAEERNNNSRGAVPPPTEGPFRSR